MYKKLIIATIFAAGAAFAQDDLDPQFGQGPQGFPGMGDAPQGFPGMGDGPQGFPGMGNGPQGRPGQRPGGPRTNSDKMILGEWLFMEKYDTDKDGKISEKEQEAVKADAAKVREARQAEMVKKYDKDGDGKLSDEEKKAMREEFMKNRPARGERGPKGNKSAE